MAKRTCSFPGCDRPFYCKGYCTKHYRRQRTYGDPAIRQKPRDESWVTQRVEEVDGCWLWKRQTKAWHGYVQIHVRGRRRVMAHRYVYELLVGPIPEGLTLDHDCHNRDQSCLGGDACRHRRCVRPSHLVPRTSRDNTLRSSHTMASKYAARWRS